MKAFLLNNFLITTFIYDLLSNFFFAQNSTLNQIFNAKLLIESKGETAYRITNEKRHLQFFNTFINASSFNTNTKVVISKEINKKILNINFTIKLEKQIYYEFFIFIKEGKALTCIN